MRAAGKAINFKGGILAAVLAVSGVFSADARAENLADALASAYNNSGLIQQNQALLRAADEDVGLAVSTLRPVIDFIIDAQRDYSKTTSSAGVLNRRNTTNLEPQIAASWTLFDGGVRQFNVAAQKETVLATRQKLLSVEQNVLLRAIAAYFNVQLQSENVAIQRNNLRVLGEELRAAQDRFDVGEVTRTDVALAESRVAAARSNLAAAQGDLANARAEYASSVGHAPGSLAPQSRLPAPPRSVAAAQDFAARNHPDILAAQHEVKAAELAIKSAQKTLGPSVEARAQVSINEQLNSSTQREDAFLQLRMQQRLYQGGGLAAQVRRAMAQRDSRRGNLLFVQRDTLQDVDDAFVRLQVAQASLRATAERVRAAQVAFDGIREEATLGARTTLDVLSAEQELLNARIAQVSARSEQSVAAYQLLAVQGVLTAEKLGLAVQIYDPVAYYNLAKDAPAAKSKQAKQLDRVLKSLGKR